ncbi:lysophospholipid acyltransferase family protein [Falsochrobactrum tianjinense]|nr:lysophospholipid acyltransferase family protein [Falsochrobactrum sp. TDYN1]
MTVKRKRTDGFAKNFWRRIRGPLARSDFIKSVLVQLITGYLKFVHVTNPRLKDSADPEAILRKYSPSIVTFWHGQHIMAPLARPEDLEVVAMFSRSNDAELNARVAEKFGFITVRGSGGRRTGPAPEKGGARALLTLKNALKKGQSASMIADIAHGKAREAGQGIILLAKLSGRPIVPFAYAFSRNHVLQKTWDKTTIPLPFGHSMVVCGDLVWVDSDADEAQLEEKRMELTRQLNDATTKAYSALERAK